MTNPVIYAAAYLLLTAHAPGGGGPVGLADAVKLDCKQLPPSHLTIRWVDGYHARHPAHHRRHHH